GEALARAIAARAVTELARGADGFARALNGRVAVVLPRFSDLAARITIEDAMLDGAGWLRAALAPAGIAPEPVLVGIEPTDDEIRAAAESGAAADATILFLYDAHLYPSNRALLEAVQAKARRLAVVVMRDPWDAALLAPGVGAVTAWGWRRCQLEAALARLVHG
ncbi:MAG TPA: hypothetical protein VNN07_17095, partial [Candidatus Tectomicrobia bacterium]|nr:hypothetical protein [Candidatus Tectomicrobia bacterium]